MFQSQLPLELKTALMLKDEGRYQDAEQGCRQFLTREPDHAEARYILGSLLLEQLRSKEALAEFQQAVSQARANGDYWLGLTQALLDLDRPREAFQTIDDLIGKGLDWPAALEVRERAREAVNRAPSGQSQADSRETTKVYAEPESESSWTLLLRGDLSFCVPSDIKDPVTYLLLEQEDWHDPAFSLLESLVQPGLRVTDISGEYGLFGLLLARTLEPDGHVRIQLPDETARNLAQASAGRNAITCSLELQVGPFTAASQVTGCDLLILSASALSIETLLSEGGALAEKSPLLILHRLNEQPEPRAWHAALEQIGLNVYRHLPGLNVLVEDNRIDAPALDANTLFAFTSKEAEQLRACGLLADWPTGQEPSTKSAKTWQQAFYAFPFVASQFGERMLIEGWKDTDRGADPHWPAYEHALNAYLSAQATEAHPTERLAWLLKSRDQLGDLLQIGDSQLSTLMLRIRVLSGCGEHKAALKLAQTLLRRLEKGFEVVLDRPFLPVHSRYDYLAPTQDIPTWLLAGILEALERLRGSSAWFPVSEPPRQFDQMLDAHPQMQRRHYLYRYRRSGKFCVPHQCRLRTEASAEHLNADWWSKWPIQERPDWVEVDKVLEGADETDYVAEAAECSDATEREALLRKAIGLNRNNIAAYLALADLMLAKGDQREALFALKEAERLGELPSSAKAALEQLPTDFREYQIYLERTGQKPVPKTEKPLRILVVTNLLPPQEMGGFGRTMWEFCQALISRGHTLRILTAEMPHLYRDPGADMTEVEQHAKRTLRLYGDWRDGRTVSEPDPERRQVIANANTRAILAEAEHFKPNACLAGNLDFLDFRFLHELLKRNIPVVHRLGNAATGYPIQATPQSPLFCLAGASDWLLRELAAQGYRFPNTAVLPPGSELHACYRAFPARFDVLRLCFVGLVMPYKGPQILMQALAELHRHGIPFTCEFAGDTTAPEFVEQLKSFAGNWGFTDRVVFSGYLDRTRLPQLYARSNVLVFPSQFAEPFGKSQIEAMAAGLVVVSSGTGGAGEIVQHERNGLLFDKADAGQLAEQLIQLATEPGMERANQLARQG
ncbi:glycosyltransferase [Thiorhodovibrio litoralis]|uniref:glycosyltransferase n=1 Tax=Thiorhodovibrio litoralis TaxID=2952932 RepID=UPI002B260F34|nr:glycosyltransferase [Thiorhodovibrio litoralis]WPL11570.1 Spore coat protein SA [Thiorhodovibrio litoralis]